jgi:hypothetical protein
MDLVVDTFSEPKAGNTREEYEDAYWPLRSGLIRLTGQRRVRVAVADGASEGSFSSRWAQMLVREFCRLPGRRLDTCLGAARNEWNQWAQAHRRDREEHGRPLQWFEEPKFEQGSFATLLGVEFRLRRLSSSTHGWTAYAVGDACLFHVRRDVLVAAFPLDHCDAFTSKPALVPSKQESKRRGSSVAQRRSGLLMRGDRMYLVTDALAQWVLCSLAAGQAPWILLERLGQTKDEAFSDFVSQLRSRAEVRNDDVTLIRLSVR